MEGVVLLGFGDVDDNWGRHVGREEAVAQWEGFLCLQLLLDPFVCWELAQALGDLPAIFDCKEPQVTVPLA